MNPRPIAARHTPPTRRQTPPRGRHAATRHLLDQVADIYAGDQGDAILRNLDELGDARARSSTHGAPIDGGTQPSGHSDPTANVALNGADSRLEDPTIARRHLEAIRPHLEALFLIGDHNKPRPRPVSDASLAWCQNPDCPNGAPVKKKKMNGGRCKQCIDFQTKHGRPRNRADITPDTVALNNRWNNQNNRKATK